MNVIISNKQKKMLDSVNIDAIKELNGLFNIDEIINNFKDYFFNHLIIDATGIVDFAKESVLRKLVSVVSPDKIILFLPGTPEPPKKFKDLLIGLGITKFTTNINGVIHFLDNFNKLDSINKDLTNYDDYYNNSNNDSNNNSNKIVLGFNNLTEHAGSTTLIYMMKECLENELNMDVQAFEINKFDFRYFNSPKMESVSLNEIRDKVNNSTSQIILIDLNNNEINNLCNDLIILVEPSIIKINRLLSNNRYAFSNLNNKIVLNKSMLNDDDVIIFGKEAGINIYYSLPYMNDRINNEKILNFINKLKIS